MTESEKKHKKLVRKAMSQLNKIYAPVRKRFDVKLGVRLNETSASVYCIDKETDESVFGADINVFKRNIWDNGEVQPKLEVNHGSLGSYNPSENTNGAALGLLIGITVTKWDKLEPVFKEAFQDYAEAFPRKVY